MVFQLPGRRFWEGIYVLYDYSAPRTASQQVQKYLSTPIAGNELNILRCACPLLYIFQHGLVRMAACKHRLTAQCSIVEIDGGRPPLLWGKPTNIMIKMLRLTCLPERRTCCPRRHMTFNR